MSDSLFKSDAEGMEREAYAWVQRRHDGLSATEAVEFRQWLAADPRRVGTVADFQKEWDRFGVYAADVAMADSEPDLTRFGIPSRKQASFWLMRRLAPCLAAVAAVGVTVFLWKPWMKPAPAQRVALVLPAPCEQRVLPDGSTVELNRGANIAVEFSTAERRIHLLKGEANFIVAKNPNRPFIVDAGGVWVRAVGTVFNVRFDEKEVRIVVTEGTVRYELPSDASRSAVLDGSAPSLSANQRAVVPLAAAAVAPEVVTLEKPQLERELLWQPKMLDFDDAGLADIAAEFNRRNPVRLVVDEATLGGRRMTASMRSDNVEGFVRLLESNLGIRAERIGENEILLTRQ